MMIHLVQLLQELQALPDPAVDAAVADALAHADQAERERLAEFLLHRAASGEQAALIRQFHLLSGKTRRLLADDPGKLSRAAREAASDHHGQTSLNLIEFIHTTKDLSLVYLLPDLLRRTDVEVRAKATSLLLAAARDLANRSSSAWTPRSRSRQHGLMLEALHQAIAHDEADRASLLEALLWLFPASRASLRKLLDPRQSSVRAEVCRLIEDPDQAVAAHVLLPMLRFEATRSAACSGIARLARRRQWSLLADPSHYLLCASTRGGLRELRDASAGIPDAPLADATPATVRWIASLPIDPSLRTQRLLEFHKCPHIATREAALRALRETPLAPHELPTFEVMQHWLEDENSSLASASLRYIQRCISHQPAQLLPLLLKNRHESIRKLGAIVLGNEAFGNLWRQWNVMSPEQRRTAGHALLKLGVDFRDTLLRKLKLCDAPSLLRAMGMIEALSLGSLFEASLVDLALHADNKIAASALKALATARSHRAVMACEIALQHPDARVRANAVEALESLQSRRHLGRLLRMAHEESNRAQANAIKSLLRHEPTEALASLARMLSDQRPEYRHSALWLVETLNLDKVFALVHELARIDPDPALRERARRVSAKLRDGIHEPHAA